MPARALVVEVTYPAEETHDAPAAGEDRLVWTPRVDGGWDLDADLEAPRNVPVASVEVGAVEIVEGRIRLHLRVRPASATAPAATPPRC